MSTDGGDSWTTPVRINQTPAPGNNPLRRQAIIPSVEVGPGGVLDPMSPVVGGVARL
jgi:hypothetical protein